MKWRARVEPKLIHRSWGGESVVFSPISGETHFLNAFSYEVLTQLESQPLTVEDIVDRLAELTAADQAADLPDNVAMIVQRFDHIGLIEPCRD